MQSLLKDITDIQYKNDLSFEMMRLFQGRSHGFKLIDDFLHDGGIRQSRDISQGTLLASRYLSQDPSHYLSGARLT